MQASNSISILYFASLGDALGVTEEVFELPETNCTITQLITSLGTRSKIWQEQLSSPKIHCAVNQTLAKRTDRLQPGDEVAFFPPVTGG